MRVGSTFWYFSSHWWLQQKWLKSTEVFPSWLITLIVPFAAGGPNDVGIIVTDHMAKTLGQSIIIENVSGAGGTIGSGRAAKAAPDGYTMVLVSGKPRRLIRLLSETRI